MTKDWTTSDVELIMKEVLYYSKKKLLINISPSSTYSEKEYLLKNSDFVWGGRKKARGTNMSLFMFVYEEYFNMIVNLKVIIA